MFTVVLALAAGLAAVAPTSAHASPSGVTRHSDGFWIAMTPGETFARAVSRTPERTRAQVVATLHRMLQREEAGRGVSIPETKNGALVNVKASRSDLTGALAAAEKTATKTAATALSAHTAVSPASAPQSTFPVRGEPCGSDRAWCDLVYELDGELCTDTCELKDKLLANLTVNPSVFGSNYVAWTVIYSPDSGDFDGYHFQWWVLKYTAENQCGTGNTNSYSTGRSNTFTTDCDVNLWNSRNTTAVEFWGHFVPYGSYISDQAKDGTAVCQPETTENTWCLY